jgi:hypothetical protein
VTTSRRGAATRRRYRTHVVEPHSPNGLCSAAHGSVILSRRGGFHPFAAPARAGRWPIHRPVYSSWEARCVPPRSRNAPLRQQRRASARSGPSHLFGTSCGYVHQYGGTTRSWLRSATGPAFDPTGTVSHSSSGDWYGLGLGGSRMSSRCGGRLTPCSPCLRRGESSPPLR